jgi:hypothetical protein
MACHSPIISIKIHLNTAFQTSGWQTQRFKILRKTKQKLVFQLLKKHILKGKKENQVTMVAFGDDG